jgi:hypothetical protein
MTATIAIDLYRRVLGHYREGELRLRFGPKYVERWRQAFMSIPEITVDTTDVHP